MAFRMHAARPRGGKGRPGPPSPAAAGGTGWCPLSDERKRKRSERFRIVAGDSRCRPRRARSRRVDVDAAGPGFEADIGAAAADDALELATHAGRTLGL